MGSTPAAMAFTMVMSGAGAGVIGGGILRPSGARVAVELLGTMLLGVVCGSIAHPAWRRRGLVLACLLLAVVGGLWRGTSSTAQLDAALHDHINSGAMTITGEVSGDLGGNGRTLVIAVRAIDGAAAGGRIAAAPRPGTGAVDPGDTVSVAVSRLRQPGERPGAESRARLQADGVSAIAVSPALTLLNHGQGGWAGTVAWCRGRLRSGVEAVLPGPDAALLLGIVAGIRPPLPGGLTADMQATGLFHIVVVSGLKVAIVAGLMRRLADRCAWPPWLRIAITVPAVGAYAIIGGAGPAAIRSGVMAVLALLLSRSGRRTDTLPLLALTGGGMLLADPSIWREAGFQLSFLGTLGIVALAHPIEARLPGPRLITEPFAVTIAAQLATVPVMAATFGTLSLIGPLANTLVLPLLPVLIVLGGLGAALASLSPAVGWLPLQLSTLGLDWLQLVAQVLARVPGGSINPGAWPATWTVAAVAAVLVAAGIGLVVERHRVGTSEKTSRRSDPPSEHAALHALAMPGRASTILAAVAGALITMLIVTAIGGRPDGRLHLTVLDVGGGTAVLIQTADGQLALVDSGTSAARLDEALGRRLPATVRSLDLLVLTGGERAVAGGLAGVTTHHRVSRIALPDADLGTSTRTAVLDLHDGGSGVLVVPPGRIWSWGGALWRCLPAPPSATAATAPACVLQITDGSGTALLLGSLPPASQDEFAAIQGSTLRADVLVTPAGGALSAPLLEAVAPRRIGIPGGAAGAAPPRLPAPARLTGVDGDLEYTLGETP